MEERMKVLGNWQKGASGDALRRFGACLAILLALLAWVPFAPAGAGQVAPSVTISTVHPGAIGIGCHHHGGSAHTSHAGCGQVAALPPALARDIFSGGQSVRRAFTSTTLSGIPLTLESPPPKSLILI